MWQYITAVRTVNYCSRDTRSHETSSQSESFPQNPELIWKEWREDQPLFIFTSVTLPQTLTSVWFSNTLSDSDAACPLWTQNSVCFWLDQWRGWQVSVRIPKHRVCREGRAAQRCDNSGALCWPPSILPRFYRDCSVILTEAFLVSCGTVMSYFHQNCRNYSTALNQKVFETALLWLLGCWCMLHSISHHLLLNSWQFGPFGCFF